MKKVALLGSTGSIGTQALEVIEKHGLKVTALAANRQAEKLAEQAKKFHPECVCIYDEFQAGKLKELLSGENIEILTGMNGYAAYAVTGVRLYGMPIAFIF